MFCFETGSYYISPWLAWDSLYTKLASKSYVLRLVKASNISVELTIAVTDCHR